MIPSPIFSIPNGDYIHHIYDESLGDDPDVDEGSFHSYLFNIEDESFCPGIRCDACPYQTSHRSCIPTIRSFLSSHLSHIYPEAFI